jgi:hypothetical protein
MKRIRQRVNIRLQRDFLNVKIVDDSHVERIDDLSLHELNDEIDLNVNETHHVDTFTNHMQNANDDAQVNCSCL